MTVVNTTSKIRANGNGSVVAFVFSFNVADETELEVSKIDTSVSPEVATLQTLTTDYTVALNTDSEGGTVTFVVAPLSTEDSFIKRVNTLDQATDIPKESNFPEESLENALDKLTKLVQQLQEQMDRALTLPETSSSSTPELPEPSTGKGLVWDANGNLINSTDDFNDIVTDAAASAAAALVSQNAAAASAVTAANEASAAAVSAAAALVSETNAAASAAGVNLPSIQAGDSGKILSVKATEDGYELGGAPVKFSSTDNNNVVEIDNNGTGRVLSITQDGDLAANGGVKILQTVSDAHDLVVIQKMSAVSSGGNGDVLVVTQNSTDGGRGLKVTNYGTLQAILVANEGAGMGVYIQQSKVLAAGNQGLSIYSNVANVNGDSALVKSHQDNSSSSEPAVEVVNDGSAPAVEVNMTNTDNVAIEITIQAAGRGHINMNPVGSASGTTEGMLYMDNDGIMYIRSNSAFAACNAAADFSELMECIGDGGTYEDGDVIVLTDNKKVTKSSSPYQLSVIGVVSEKKGRSRFIIDRSDRPYSLPKNIQKKIAAGEPLDKQEKKRKLWFGKTFKELNFNIVQVGLIGLVDCKVCSDGGDIEIGDLLVSSSLPGFAMKANITSFNQLPAIIGKARESLQFTGGNSTGKIAIIVGVK